MVSSSSRQRESQQSISLWPCDLHKNEEWRTSTSRTLHIKSFPLWRSQFFCLRTSRPGLLFLHRRLGQNQIACLHREARVPRGSGTRPRRLRFLVMWLRVSQETRNLNTPPPTHPSTFWWKYISWRDGRWNGGQVQQRSASFISPKKVHFDSWTLWRNCLIFRRLLQWGLKPSKRLSRFWKRHKTKIEKWNEQIWFWVESSDQNWNESLIYNTDTASKQKL